MVVDVPPSTPLFGGRGLKTQFRYTNIDDELHDTCTLIYMMMNFMIPGFVYCPLMCAY
jgi:hypothetical protein